jgi:hypothetical protein
MSGPEDEGLPSRRLVTAAGTHHPDQATPAPGDDPPSKDRLGKFLGRSAWQGIGAIIGFAALVVAVLAVLAGAPHTGPGSSTSPSPSTSASDSTSSACPVSGQFDVEILRVRPRDGMPGISDDLLVDLNVRQRIPNDHAYWVFAKVTNGHDGFVYVAKSRIPDGMFGEGPQGVRLLGAKPGTGRSLFVVDGNREARAWMEANAARDGDSSWDDHRTKLPAGVVIVSNSCWVVVKRT